MKGESGRHLTTNPPFGYLKDEQDKDKWLIDEEAAKTVRYIFKLCCDGFGPTQIANRLRWEQVLTPTAYKAQQRGELLPERPFQWAQKTVSGILDKVEYLGHTENFKTASKNYRSKKRVKTAKEERKLFRDTHPAIVDEHTFQVVQEIRSHRHRPTATGKVSIFSGKVFCADCGAKLQYCTAHYIRAVTVEKIVLAHMKRVLAHVQQFKTAFVKREMEKANLKRQTSMEKAKLDIVTLKRRDEDLDVLFKRIYEDMVAGRLSPERFDKLSTQYEEEQKQVRQAIGELQSLIDDGEQEAHDLRQFLKSVRKYTDPEELTAEMLNELVDKIIVHAPDKSSGHRKQKIEIYYKAAGIIDIADDLCEVGDGRGQWRKERKTA